jgi:DNA-directed RNA polymerase subunit RPC12/RpoP
MNDTPASDIPHVLPAATGQKEFPCQECGAKMVFDPQAASIKCPYCGHAHPVPKSEEEIEELDFHAHLARLAEVEQRSEQRTVKCTGCGAESILQEHISADRCPYCDSPIVAQTEAHVILRPRCLLPFRITRQQAIESFRRWVQSLWFAPTRLKLYARTEATHLQGVYVPYWTYDCGTVAFYRGERGDDYWDTETYQARENDRWVTKTRQVRKTRWWPVSGVVYDTFDDVLVLASRSMPRSLAGQLTPWDLANLVAFDEKYLAGYRAECYQVELDDGFEEAKTIMDEHIRRHICQDIGGDHQRIHHVSTQHNDVTFKHILLPVWISSYRFQNKLFRFMVNARTGEVYGERPYSFWKILGVILLIAAVIGLVAALFFLIAGQ